MIVVEGSSSTMAVVAQANQRYATLVGRELVAYTVLYCIRRVRGRCHQRDGGCFVDSERRAEVGVVIGPAT